MSNNLQKELELSEEQIDRELRRAYFSYADNVIRTRSLPDVRDGLKSVQRRILTSMFTHGNRYTDRLRKSATVAGNVTGELHPHGTEPVYQAMVRMAQEFNTNMLYMEKQGNFGSIDGDSAAAMRYTEVKMSQYAHEFFYDYNKNTVPMQKNYDESMDEPCVLPATVPNLLINGSYGIAVGISTSIPPHNITEIINGALFYLDNNGDVTIDQLLEYIKGPDLPTGGQIFYTDSLRESYTTGEGSFVVRAKYEIENDNVIIIKEIPYQICKSTLMKQIATVVQDKQVEGITTIRDESDFEGIRIYLKIKQGYDSQVVLNQLFKHTNLQTFNRICLFAINENQQPQIYNLKTYFKAFLEFRNRIIINRNMFDLDKIQKRLHILLGFIVAQENLDEIVSIIRSAENNQDAKQKLSDKAWNNGELQKYLNQLGIVDSSSAYKLSKEQVDSILSLQLSALVRMEKTKLYNELEKLQIDIVECCENLNSQEKRTSIIRQELLDVLDRHSKVKRKSTIIDGKYQLSNLDAMTPKDIVVILDDEQYIRRVDLDSYKTQNRGGVGISGAKVNVLETIITNTHSIILFFSDQGLVYKLHGYQIPSGSNNSKGRALVNLLQLKSHEKIVKFVVITQDQIANVEKGSLFFLWANGMVRRSALSDFISIKSNGKMYQSSEQKSELIKVLVIDESHNELIIATKQGKSIVIDYREFRPTKSRTGSGVIGIRIKSKDQVIGASVLTNESKFVLSVSDNGYGKITERSEYSVIHRGGSGVINMKCNSKTGNVIALLVLENREGEMVLFTSHGRTLRLLTSQVSVIGRNTIGVRLCNLKSGDKIIGVELCNPELYIFEDSETSKDSVN